MKLIFLGPPGAGKGTIAKLVVKDIGLTHISTGDLFRAAIKNKAELGLKVKSIIDAGDLVPDELTIALVKERLSEPDLENGFILDGFPRTIAQAEALESFCKIDNVINFEISEDKIIQRLSGRRLCKNCGEGFHIKFMPPKVENRCDKCQGELYIRKDDEPESIKNRLVVYTKSTEPLINYYADKNLITNIEAGNSPEEVSKELLGKI